MRIYSAFDEASLRARRLIREWASDGLLNAEQRARLEADVEPGLRRTNSFMRAVLFFFTTLSVAAGVALVTELWSIRAPAATAGLMFVCAVLSYGLAEYAVARAKLYRHGIEEALAVLAVVFICLGIAYALAPNYYSLWQGSMSILVPAAGAAASLYIYLRFGYQYAVLATLIFLAFIPSHIVTSMEARRLVLCGAYLIGLVCFRLSRRNHRQDDLDEQFGALESMHWLALYLTLNLQLTSLDRWTFWMSGGNSMPGTSRPFYWVTYGLIWLLPALAIRQALKEKDKPLLDIGVVMGLLTLVTNKPYLGWPRHEWDAMILGVFLVGTAVVVRKWLAGGLNGVRNGLTARRISASDKKFLSVLGTAAGVFPAGHGPTPGPATPKPSFEGGRSGGGGASSSF